MKTDKLLVIINDDPNQSWASTKVKGEIKKIIVKLNGRRLLNYEKIKDKNGN